MISIRAVVAAALIGIAAPALAEPENENWPNYQEGDFIIKDYKFASGQTLSQLKLHYRTLGSAKRNGAGEIVNGVLLLQGNTGNGANWLRPTLADELFQEGRVWMSDNTSSSCPTRSVATARASPRRISYSHVVTVSGSGRIVYTAGQLARDVDGNCVGKGDMRAQMEQTFQNLDRCLKAAADATWADVVKTNTFVTDFDEFQKCADIRMRYLGVATPTSTTVGVTRLAGPDFMIEIEAVAVVNS